MVYDDHRKKRVADKDRKEVACTLGILSLQWIWVNSLSKEDAGRGQITGTMRVL